MTRTQRRVHVWAVVPLLWALVLVVVWLLWR